MDDEEAAHIPIKKKVLLTLISKSTRATGELLHPMAAS